MFYEAATPGGDPFLLHEHYRVMVQTDLLGQPEWAIFACDLACGCGCEQCELINAGRAGTLTLQQAARLYELLATKSVGAPPRAVERAELRAFRAWQAEQNRGGAGDSSPELQREELVDGFTAEEWMARWNGWD